MGSSLLLLVVPQGLPEISFFVRMFVSFFSFPPKLRPDYNQPHWLIGRKTPTYLLTSETVPCQASESMIVFTRCKRTLVLLITKPVVWSLLWRISTGIITVLYHLVVTLPCFSVPGLELQTLPWPGCRIESESLRMEAGRGFWWRWSYSLY